MRVGLNDDIDTLIGLRADEIVDSLGVPTAIGFTDDRVFIAVASEYRTVDFTQYRVVYDFHSINRRVWFNNGLVDSVISVHTKSDLNRSISAQSGSS